MCDQEFTLDTPEQGKLWHALDAVGRRVFEQHPAKFGRPTPETRMSPQLKNALCIRCRPAREQVAPWLRPDGSGGILAVDRSQLQEEDIFVWTQTGDIHVRASAAVAAGTIVPEDSEPSAE
ncbi:MAG: hypothetical protein KAS72_04215 [Phycisphaerales bacterium]|nr:hypothetical protein [Phycisphaerales bacterium]